jgi:hypothetical protein
VRNRTEAAAATRRIAASADNAGIHVKGERAMSKRTLVRMVAGAFLAGGAGAALAADITMIQPSAATVTVEGGRPVVVQFTVSGRAASGDRCGYFVEYGDGAAGDSRIIEKENGGFSRPHERSFSKPGTYTVKASGKNVKTTSACNGASSTTVTVVAAAAAPARSGRTGAAPTCPEGWMLNEKSVNWRTGAFSCARKPTAQMACGDGLTYYEQNGLIGCRQERRNRGDRNR